MGGSLEETFTPHIQPLKTDSAVLKFIAFQHKTQLQHLGTNLSGQTWEIKVNYNHKGLNLWMNLWTTHIPLLVCEDVRFSLGFCAWTAWGNQNCATQEQLRSFVLVQIKNPPAQLIQVFEITHCSTLHVKKKNRMCLFLGRMPSDINSCATLCGMQQLLLVFEVNVIVNYRWTQCVRGRKAGGDKSHPPFGATRWIMKQCLCSINM